MLFCYLCGHEQFLLVNFKALDRTLTYGLDDFSPLAFSGTAIALVSLRNVRDASILARIALDLASSSYPLDIQCTFRPRYKLQFWYNPNRIQFVPLRSNQFEYLWFCFALDTAYATIYETAGAGI